jgi:hypothetical protein
MEFEPNYDQQQRIDNATDSFFEQILWKIKEGEVSNADQLREAVHECDWNECVVIGLCLEDQLDLAQEYGSDFGMDLGDVSLDNLRSKIEGLAIAAIHYLAEQKVAERLQEIEDLMDEHGLELEEAEISNRLEYFPHTAERDMGDGCTIFQYRNVEEPGQAVDVWEVRLDGGNFLYFHVDLNED